MGDEWWKKDNGLCIQPAKDVTQSEDHLRYQTNNHHAVLMTKSTLSISKNNLSPISPQ